MIALSFFLLIPLIDHTVKNEAAVLRAWKPCKTDKVNSFISHLQGHDQFDTFLENRKNSLLLHQVEEQILIVFCGPLYSLECCHVTLNDTVWNFKKPLDAVDFSFKLSHTQKVDYPLLCVHIYCFLHKFIYKLKKKRKIVADTKLNSMWEELSQIA